MGIAVILFAIMACPLQLRFAVSPATLLRKRLYPLYLLGYSTMDRLHQLRGPVWHLFTVTLVGALVFANALAYLVERRALRALRH